MPRYCYTKRIFSIGIALILSLFFVSLVRAESEISPEYKQKSVVSLSSLSDSDFTPLFPLYYEDVNSNLTLDEISRKYENEEFLPVKMASMGFGYKASDIWIKFSVWNDTLKSKEFILDFDHAILNSISLFYTDTEGFFRNKKSGTQYVFSERDVYARTPNFLESLAPGEKREYWAKIRSDTSISVGVRLWHPSAFHQYSQDEKLWYGVFFGGIIFLGIYNLFLAIYLREKAHFEYVCYIVSFTLFTASLNGLVFQHVIPNHPKVATTFILFFMCLSLFFCSRFCMTFLRDELKGKRVHTVLQGAAYVTGGTALLTFVLPYSSLGGFATFLGIAIVMTIMWASVYGVISGSRPSMFFALAWSTFLIGCVLLGLKAYGLLPSNTLTNHLMQIGAGFEILLLSLALAARISLERKEKYLAQKRMAEANEAAYRSHQEAMEAQNETLKERERAMASEQRHLKELVAIASQISDKLNSPLLVAENVTEKMELRIKEILSAEAAVSLSPEEGKRLLLQMDKHVNYMRSSITSIRHVSCELSKLRELAKIEATEALEGAQFQIFQKKDAKAS